MKAVLRFGFVAVSFACVVNAAEYTFVPTSGGWNDPKSYIDADGNSPLSTPGSEDVVKLPEGSYEVSAPSADFTALAKIGRISPSNAKLVVDVAEGEPCEMEAKFASGQAADKSSSGELVKRGKGTLKLTGKGYEYSSADWSYICNITVEDGRLSLPDFGADYRNQRQHGIFAVSNGAVLVLSPQKFSYSNCRGLRGGGIVTNELSAAVSLNVISRFAGESTAFTGSLGGFVNLTMNGPAFLGGGRSTFSGAVSIQRQYFTDAVECDGFGSVGEPSNFGIGEAISVGERNGGNLRYVGSGEKTDKKFYVCYNASTTGESTAPSIDAGPVGNLLFTGLLSGKCYSSTLQGMDCLELKGTNSMPCVIDCPIDSWRYDNTSKTYYSLHVKKSGSGTWELSGNAGKSTNAGALTVEEGTLRYDSLAEVGTSCSLGTATNLMEFYTGAWDETKRIPWAFTLGSQLTAGCLEYIGTNRAITRTRKTGLAGEGRFRHETGKGSVFFAGVEAVAASADGRLVLDGEDVDSDDTFTDITDGKGSVSVVKTGAGKWTLERELSFSGDLIVSNGTLVVRAGDAPYTWFRFTQKSDWGSDFAKLQELGLYAADGTRQNLNLKYNHGEVTHPTDNSSQSEPLKEVADLAKGEATYGRKGYVKWYSTGYRDIDGLFDDSMSGTLSVGWVLTAGPGGTSAPALGTPSTWIPIVMRLSDDAKEVAMYDFCTAGGMAAKNVIKDYSFEGSVDGVYWDVLTNATYGTEAPATVVNNTWYYSGKAHADGKMHAAGEGFPLCGHGTNTFAQLNKASVFVAPGAILRAEGSVTISKLAVSAEGGVGTIDGFAFAANGELDIRAANPKFREATFSLGDGATVANVANWTLCVNGTATSKKELIYLGNGKFCVRSKGLVLIVK